MLWVFILNTGVGQNRLNTYRKHDTQGNLSNASISSVEDCYLVDKNVHMLV